MAFDIEGAKKAGYSDAEIAGFLGQQNKFDVPSAVKSGYTYPEIISHLSTPPQDSGFLTKAADLGKSALAGLTTGSFGAPEAIEAGGQEAAKSTTFLPTEALSYVSDPRKLANQLTGALGFGQQFKEQSIVPNTLDQKQRLALDETLAKGKIPQFRQLTELGNSLSDQIKESISPQTKKAMAESQPTGNIIKALQTGDFSEISIGNDPSALGMMGHVANVFGTAAPSFLIAAISKNPTVVGAAGFGQAGSEAINEARDHIKKMNDQELSKNSPYFANLLALGYTPKDARLMTESKAGDTAAMYQGLVGALGNQFTSKLLHGGFDKLLLNSAKSRLGQVAAGTALAGVEGGASELAEGVAADLGINKTVVREIGVDSFANLVLGAIGEAAPGAARGFVSKTQPQAAPEEEGKPVLQKGKNVTVEGAPPTSPPGAPAGTPPAGQQDLGKFKALEDQDIEEQDKEKIDRLDALEAEFKTIDEKYKTATPAEFGDLNRRQGEITKEMNDLVAGEVTPVEVTPAVTPAAPQEVAPPTPPVEKTVATPKAPEKIKPPRKIIPQEFTPEEIAFVGQVVGSGNGLQYNDEVKPVLKKFEKAGLLNIKNNKVYVSQEAEAAGIRGGDSFVRFTDSPDMDRVRKFVGYNLPVPKPTTAETKPAEPVNREAVDLLKERFERNIPINVVSSNDGKDWYASGQRIRDQRYLIKLDLTPAEFKKAEEIQEEMMDYMPDSDERADLKDKLSAHLTPAAKRAIGLVEEEKPKTKAEINKERQAKQREAAEKTPIRLADASKEMATKFANKVFKESKGKEAEISNYFINANEKTSQEIKDLEHTIAELLRNDYLDDSIKKKLKAIERYSLAKEVHIEVKKTQAEINRERQAEKKAAKETPSEFKIGDYVFYKEPVVQYKGNEPFTTEKTIRAEIKSIKPNGDLELKSSSGYAVKPPSDVSKTKLTQVEEKPAEKKAEEKFVIDDEGEKLDFPLFVDMAAKGYKVLGFDNPRAYTDKAGNTYRTIERDGVRLALQPNKLLFKQQGKEYGRVATGIGKEKDITFEHLIVDPEKRKQGLAKQALQDLIDVADKNGYTVFLEPAQLEKKGITKEQLSDLYSKYGFVATNESGNPMERTPKLVDESRTIDVEATEITPSQMKLLTNQVGKLSDADIATLEEHYGIPNSSMDFMKRIREDIITYTNKGAEAIDKAIRSIIAKLQAGMLSVAMVFNPAYMSEQSVVVYPSKVTTEEVRAEVPDSASEMSDSGKKAFSILFAALQPEMQANDKLFTIVDKPTSKAFVFQPNGSLLLKDNVVLGKSLGDVYVGQTEFKGNQITPAGALRVKKEKGSATYDGRTIYTVGNVKEGWNVAFMHTVYLKEADAAARKQALATGQGTRLSHGCVNAQPEVMDKLEEGDRMDKSIVFVVPDDQTKVHDYIANTVSNEDLTRETIKPATKTTKTEEVKVERKIVGREQEATEPRKTQAEINRERQAKKRGEKPTEEPYIPLNMVSDVEIPPIFLLDSNPGGEWLRHKKEKSIEDGRLSSGVPRRFGSATAYFRAKENVVNSSTRTLLIPVDIAAKFQGMNDEQRNVRSGNLKYLTDYMGKNNRLPFEQDGKTHYSPYINVYQNGTPYVNEGNHRIMAAKALGWKYIPLAIDYFNGAELENGPLSPAKAIEYDRKAHEEGYTLVNYAARTNTLEMLSPGAYERALNKQVNKDREDSQQEYRNVRAAVRRKTKEVAKVGSTLPLQKELNVLLESEQNIKNYLDATYKEDRRPIAFKLKAVEEEKKGNLAPEVSEFIQHIYATNPKILDGLQLSVRANKNPNSPSSANFAPYSRIVTLWKNGSGVDNPNTISHELTHSFEQMMDADTRKVVVDAWARSLEKAIKNYPGQKHQDYFDAVMEYLENPTKENYDDAIKNLKGLGYDFYQYLTPSEYWAVNGTDMMRAKLGTTWDKFVNSIKGLIEGLKSFFGMNNTYVVHKTMNKIFKGEMQRVDHGSLIGYLLRGEYKGDLQNIEEEGEEFEGSAREQYLAQREADGREDFKLKTSKSVKDMLLGSYGAAREAAKAVKESPMLAVNKMASKLDRAITYARIKGVWYGRGLEVAEVKKFNGQVRDGQEKVIASVALTNALHSGEIMSQVIMRGKLMFDTESQMFRAEDAKESLANVMLAKHDLIERVGAQEANNMIQDYFEAKRSRSILNAFQEQEGIVEKAKEKAEKIEFGTDAYYDALDEVEKAKNDFYNIAVARSKVKLSDESIDIYSALEDDNPELRNMMDNWQAVNSNNLDNMEFSGLISKKRAKSLREIEDYVPWQRIQDEMEDVHSAPVRGSTKSLTNVAKEKVFKRNAAVNKAARDYIDGEIDLDQFNEAIQKYQENLGEIDDILDNMLHNTAVLGRNSMRNHAANMVAARYAERYTEGKKKGKLKLYREEGRDDNGVRLNIVVNGRRVIVNIPDPLIAEAVIGMENINMPAVEIFAVMANLLRRGITTWPQFQLRQLFMDAPTAAMVSGLGAKNSAILYADTFKSFLNALNSEDPIVRHLKAYGIGGFQSYTRSPEQQYKQQIGLIEQNKLNKFTNFLDKVGDASDMAQRIATYKRVLAETGDETLALMRSNNIIDFKKHGNAKMVVAITRSVSFMNAYAQQLDVLAEALAGGGLKGKNRAAAFASMLKVAAMLTAWTTIYTMIMGGNDDYEKMDDQKKARNFVIPKNIAKYIGVDDNILLPMNTSAAYFFKAMPELITNYVIKKGTKNEVDGTRLRKALAEAAIDSLLGPNPIPTGIKPAVEIGLNRNFFTGGAITPKGLENLDAAEQYNASTSELGKVLSAVAGGVLNPIEMDHLVRGIFGTNGAVVMWGSNMLSGDRPTAEQKDNPLWGGLMDRDVGRGPESLFYDLKSEVEPKHKTFMKLIEREKDEEADKYFNKHEKEIAAYEYVTGIESALKEINKEIRRVGEVRDPKFSKDDRRKEIQELQNTKNEILEDVIQIRKEAGL